MLKIKPMTEENLWDVASFCYRQPEQHSEYAVGDVLRFRQGHLRRAEYLSSMLPKGGRAQIAYLTDEVVGFIEYYPIEVTNLEVDGRDAMAIWCINVRGQSRRQGIGSALIRACLQDALRLKKRGVVVTSWDPVWMPRLPFERLGFSRVGLAGRGGVLLYHAFQHSPPPRWIGAKPPAPPSEHGVPLDIHYTNRCPIHWRNAQLIKQIAQEFGSMIQVRERSTDSRTDMLRYGTACGIYLNGKLIAAGPLANERAIRDKFIQELATLRRSHLP